MNKRLAFMILIVFTIFISLNNILSDNTKWKLIYDYHVAHQNEVDYDNLLTVSEYYVPDSLNYIAVDGNGWVVKTSDGGNNWKRILTSIDFSNLLLASGFLHQVSSYCTSPDSIIITYNSCEVLRTTNGGAIWDTIIVQNSLRLREVNFLKNGTGIGVANILSSDTTFFLKSTDFGSTWQILSNPTKYLTYYFIQIFSDNSFVCIASDTACFTCDTIKTPLLYLASTNDGGNSWKCSNSFNTFINFDYIGDMYFINSKVGWAEFERDTFQSTSSGQCIIMIYKTTDGGDTWFKQYEGFTNSMFNITRVDFLDSSTGMFIGHCGYFLETTDGGENWHVDSSMLTVEKPGSNETPRIKYINNKRKAATTISGKFYLYNEDGFTDNVKEFIDESNTINIFPNPATQAATIKFDIEQPAYVSLKLTDLLGIQITLIDNQFMDSGSHSYVWDAGCLSAGVYYYVLEVGSSVKSGKVVVVR